MANLSGFDASKVEPVSFDAVPPGEYTVMIVKSELKTTKAGDGQYLKLQMQIADGQHKGRTLFDNLNIVNSNSQAEQIAKGTLSAICRAVGVMTPKDSSELHNKPMTATVTVKDGQNQVKGYKSSSLVSQAFAATGDKPQNKSPF